MRARFSCHLPDRIALNIVRSIHQMQVMASANPPQDGSGGAGGEAPPSAGGEAPPSGDGEPTTPGGETYVRQCLQCGQMSYFRESICLNPSRLQLFVLVGTPQNQGILFGSPISGVSYFRSLLLFHCCDQM